MSFQPAQLAFLITKFELAASRGFCWCDCIVNYSVCTQLQAQAVVLMIAPPLEHVTQGGGYHAKASRSGICAQANLDLTFAGMTCHKVSGIKIDFC